MGLASKSSSAAKARADGESYSRWMRRAKRDKLSITAARDTEGVKPAIAAKKTAAGIPNTAEKTRCRRVRKKSPANRMDRCMPDTAATWEMPAKDISFCRA